MKRALKWTFITTSLVVFLLIGGLAALYYVGVRNTDDVRAICDTPAGTRIEEVIAKARALKFSEEEQGALGGGFKILGSLETTGALQVGKLSLAPFLRNYCEVSFVNRVVIATRTWTLD